MVLDPQNSIDPEKMVATDAEPRHRRERRGLSRMDFAAGVLAVVATVGGIWAVGEQNDPSKLQLPGYIEPLVPDQVERIIDKSPNNDWQE